MSGPEHNPDTGSATVDLESRRLPGVEARNGKFGGPSLIPDLDEITERCGYLPRSELVALAERRRRPLYEIQGLISFYPHFRTDPPVKVDLHVCHDLACWMAGYEERLAALRARYGEDVEVEIREVSCLGRCDQAPAVWVNTHTAEASGAEALVEQARTDTLPELTYPRPPRLWPNDPYGRDERDYRVAQSVLRGDLEPEAVIATLKDSGLRGMGGAGFPTGLKWGVVRAEAGAQKYVICNADESEPGTFKDSQILADQPHLVLEGVLIAMLVVGADTGYVYIRHEYVPEAVALRREIARMRRARAARRRTLDRGLRVARRLHPRRGDRAARGDGGAPRRAAQQAAVPGQPRSLGAAHADQLRRDAGRRADHPRARRRLVERPGDERLDRPQVLRGLRRRRGARRVLRPDGHDGRRADRPRRRRQRRAARSRPCSRAAPRRTSRASRSSTRRSTSRR